MHGYVQVAWHFLSPVGARKNMVNEQNICLYSVLSHQIRDLLFDFYFIF